MSKVRLRVDATFGVKVKVGDMVEKGDEIGKTSAKGEAVFCPASGHIRSISFDERGHEFIVVMECD